MNEYGGGAERAVARGANRGRWAAVDAAVLDGAEAVFSFDWASSIVAGARTLARFIAGFYAEVPGGVPRAGTAGVPEGVPRADTAGVPGGVPRAGTAGDHPGRSAPFRSEGARL